MNFNKICLSIALANLFVVLTWAAQPDSVYVFPYPTVNDNGRRGMQLVWSTDREQWHDVAGGMVFLKCDFGPWKHVYRPRLVQDRTDGRWHCFWDLTPDGSATGCSSSTDLIRWKPQEFFMTDEKSRHEVKDGRMPVADTVQVGDKTIAGFALKVPYGVVEGLERHGIYRSALNALRGERAEHDAARFAGLQTVSVRITVDEGRAKPISENLIGVFFEDLNYAADGGLYAELVQNRDFEYSETDGNKDKNWNSRYAWSVEGEGMTFDVSTEQPVHPNNPHYAVLDVAQPGGGFTNTGFDGIAVKEGEKYDFSLFTRTPDGRGSGKSVVRLIDPLGKTIAETTVSLSSKTWKKREAVLKATATVAQARLVIIPQSAGRYALDMISLFPQKTFKGRKNGLRADLAQAIADIRPRFRPLPRWMLGPWGRGGQHLSLERNHRPVGSPQACGQHLALPPDARFGLLRVFPVLRGHRCRTVTGRGGRRALPELRHRRTEPSFQGHCDEPWTAGRYPDGRDGAICAGRVGLDRIRQRRCQDHTMGTRTGQGRTSRTVQPEIYRFGQRRPHQPRVYGTVYDDL